MLIRIKNLKFWKRSVHLGSKYASQEHSAKALDTINDRLKLKLFEYMSLYEETIGIKEIKLAQDAVLDVSISQLVLFNMN